MVLAQIIAHKKESLKNYDLKDKKIAKSKKSFFDAIKLSQTNFIGEVKLGSPNQGRLTVPNDIQNIAKHYEKFACAISVMAEEKFFLGSMDNVKIISEIVSCPVLCKDIVVSPSQIFQARAYGADAIVLMLSVLNDHEYNECKKAAESLNLDIITEIHTKEEALRAKHLGAKIIAINNRNLKTLTVDLDVTEHLLPFIDKNCLIISESGYATHEQISRYIGKVHAFLIGSSLVNSDRIDLRLRELIFGRIKISHITNEKEAQQAYEKGAYYGTFNFTKTLKDPIDIAYAQTIIKSAPLVFGGTFCDDNIDEIIKIANELNLSFVQLDGNEDHSFIRELRKHLSSDCELFKTVSIENLMNCPEDFGADLMIVKFSDKIPKINWQKLFTNTQNQKFIIAECDNEQIITKAKKYGAFALDIPLKQNENNYEKITTLFNNLRNTK